MAFEMGELINQQNNFHRSYPSTYCSSFFFPGKDVKSYRKLLKEAGETIFEVTHPILNEKPIWLMVIGHSSPLEPGMGFLGFCLAYFRVGKSKYFRKSK